LIPTGAPEPLVLEGLTVRFGAVEALSGVTGEFRGRATGLLGPNGAGKTTLLRTLLGFHVPAAGTARVCGQDIRTAGTAVRAAVGYMPESDAYVSGLSAVRTVRLMAELSGLPRQDALERAHEALNYVGLGDARYRPVGTYSLGMRQLVKLAQAIVHGPRLLLLDEPTNALDPPARHRMLELVRDIRDSGAVQVIVSSHLLRDIESACDEVAILREGRLVARHTLARGRHVDEPAGQARELEIETGGAPEELQRAFERAGYAATVSLDGRVAVALPAGVAVRDVYVLAAAAGIEIRRLADRHETLEDLFLAAMAPGTAISAAVPA
jgi:ABC-2 type transport system ATP-binding protein